MAVPIYTVKNLDSYWERTAYWLEIHDSALQNRAEYGSGCGERGIQKAVLYTAVKLARKHDLNQNIVSSLCLATGRCFPLRGLAELAVIKEYIRENMTDIPLDTFEVDTIEHGMDHTGDMVTPQLDELLRKYYSDDESVTEVNLARFLQKYLNLHRHELESVSIYNAGKYIGSIMDRAENEYETAYRLLPDYVPPEVPQHVRDKIIKDLLSYMEWEKGETTAIYKYIW